MLVLLPGLLCDDWLWRGVVRGRSNYWIADLTQDNSLAAMASRVLAGAPERFELAALSMGGYLAFEILRQAPERVTRLGLFATSASADSPSRRGQREAAIESLRKGRFVGMRDRMIGQFMHPRFLGSELAEGVKAMTARVGGPAFLRQQEAILGRPDSLPLLPSIKVPTLVVVGEQDQLTPVSDSRDIHQGVAGSELVVLEQCGHLPPLEAPEETAELLDRWFLSR